MVHLPLVIMQRVVHLFLLAVCYLNTLDELWQVQKPEIIYLGRVPWLICFCSQLVSCLNYNYSIKNNIEFKSFAFVHKV